MTRSTPVLGTDRKTKHTHLSYIVQHCIPTGFQSMWEAFHYWKLWLAEDTSEYLTFDFLSDEEKLQHVRADFWYSINESDIETFDDLNWMIAIDTEDIESFEIVDENFFEEIEKLLSFEEEE